MRLASVLAAAGLLSAGLVGAAPAAQAAGTCSLQVPSRVVISTPYRQITTRLGSDCVASGTVYASWDAIHPTQGWQTIAIFDETTTDFWDLYDFEPLGRWTWRPSLAWDYNSDDVAQNTRYTDVKLGSWSKVTATRYGSKVSLATSAVRYSPTYERLIPWAGAYGQLQYKVPGTTTWRALKTVYSTSTGTYRYTYTTTAVRDYRVYFPATSVIWNTASATVRK
jgi:hypothetical protein